MLPIAVKELLRTQKYCIVKYVDLELYKGDLI